MAAGAGHHPVSIDLRVGGVDRAMNQLRQVQRALEQMRHVRRAPEMGDYVTNMMDRWRQQMIETTRSAADFVRHIALMPAKMFLILEAFRLAQAVVDTPKRVMQELILSFREFAEYQARLRSVAAMAGSEAGGAYIEEFMKRLARLPGVAFTTGIEGILQLMASGIAFEDAAVILYALSNAATQAGMSVENMGRVYQNVAQLWRSARVTGIDFRELLHQIPQAAQAATRVFGTIKTEEISALGYTGEQAMRMIINELLKLPPAADRALNAMDNVKEAVFLLRLSVGQAMEPFVVPMLRFVTLVIDAVRHMGILDRIIKSVFATSRIRSWEELFIRATARILALMNQMPVVVQNFGKIIEAVYERWRVLLRTIITLQVLPFSTAVINSIIAFATAMRTAQAATQGLAIATAAAAAIAGGLRGIAVGLLGALAAIGIGYLLEWLADRAMKKVGESIGIDPKKLKADSADIEKRLRDAMKEVQRSSGQRPAELDKMIGTFQQRTAEMSTPLGQIEKNTGRTAASTARIAEHLDRTVRGYGITGAEALMPRPIDLVRWRRSSPGPVTVVLQGGATFEQMLQSLIMQTIAQMRAQALT